MLNVVKIEKLRCSGFFAATLLDSRKMLPIGCPENLVTYYNFALLKIPEEFRSTLHRYSSLQLRAVRFVFSSFAIFISLVICL